MPIPQSAENITRGVARLLVDLGVAPVTEFRLPTGRRNDVMGIGRNGRFWAVEVKSSREDFLSDNKWPDYLEWADFFLFAVATDFELDLLPPEEGLILADRYHAEIIRPALERPLPPARRRSLTLSFARTAAMRTQILLDPDLASGETAQFS